MADQTLNRVLKAIRADEHAGCSDAYRWLHRRHAKIAAARAKHRPAWGPVIDEMTLAGIVGGDGKQLTRKSISKIWQRVCRDIQAKALAATSAPAVGKGLPPMRSTAPPGWRPTPVVPVPRTPPVASKTLTDAEAQAEAEAEADAEEQLARIRRHIDERSGRKRT